MGFGHSLCFLEPIPGPFMPSTSVFIITWGRTLVCLCASGDQYREECGLESFTVGKWYNLSQWWWCSGEGSGYSTSLLPHTLLLSPAKYKIPRPSGLLWVTQSEINSSEFNTKGPLGLKNCLILSCQAQYLLKLSNCLTVQDPRQGAWGLASASAHQLAKRLILPKRGCRCHPKESTL